MDLENLTKHQIILLTLLVSFITSMATGIVTVSLMDQAPKSVTRTINQIVEHTVQAVVPSSQNTPLASQKTIVVKDEDLIAQTIATVQKSIIKIVARGSEEVLARGVMISRSTALTDKAALESAGVIEFDAMLQNGTRVPLVVQIGQGTTTPFLLVTLPSTSTSTILPLPLSDVSKVHLGQSVLRISGKSVDNVGEGVVAMLPQTTGLIEASVNATTQGSVLVTQFGELVGMTTSASLTQSSDMYSIVILPKVVSSEPKPVSKP